LIYLSNYKGSIFIVKKEELMGEVINNFYKKLGIQEFRKSRFQNFEL
jgi:hypothetical protein